MRVGIVSETYPPEVNGVALTVRCLVEGLRARGHDVQLVRPRQHADPDHATGHTLLVRGADLPRYPGLRFGLPAAMRLQRLWRERRPDCLYIATEGPLGASALRAARRLGIPAATGFHTRFDQYAGHYGLGWLKPLVQWHLRRFHRRAHATLVPTEELAGELRAQGIDNVRLLARAVDVERFHPRYRDPALRAAWGARGTAPVVLYVGRIAREKHLDLAVAGFRALQAKRPEARFVWVGDGPERSMLESRHPDFVFTGVQRGENLARHYASADLFLFPSLSETFGNVVLEALASGVPTVAFARGAAAMYLRDGGNGRLVPEDREDAFAAACAACADADTLSAFGRTARDSVAHLTPERLIGDFENLLHGLGRRPERAAPLSGSPGGTPP